MRNTRRSLAVLVTLALAWTLLPATSFARTVPQTLADRRPVTAAPVAPGFPVDVLGVVAHGVTDHHAFEDVQVRFRHGRTWTAWQGLTEDGVDTDGQWASGLTDAGDADAYQVRGLPTGKGRAFVTALNTTDGPARTTWVRARGTAAEALASCRSRADWGADESLRTSSRSYAPVQITTVHHTATSNASLDDAATLRAIHRYHTVDRGFDDIGYQLLLGRDGTVYEGRWSGSDSQSCLADTDGDGRLGDGSDFAHTTDGRLVTGAHAGGYNTGNAGVALLGTYVDVAPPRAMHDGLVGVLADLSARHGLDPQAPVTYDNGVNRSVEATVSGHRDLVATECPGGVLYAQLPAIRDAVAARLAAASAPAPDPAPDTEPAPEPAPEPKVKHRGRPARDR